MLPGRSEPLPAPFYTQEPRGSGRVWGLQRIIGGLRLLLLGLKWDVSCEKLWGRHLQIRTWHLSTGLPGKLLFTLEMESSWQTIVWIECKPKKNRNLAWKKSLSLHSIPDVIRDSTISLGGYGAETVSLPIRASQWCLQSVLIKHIQARWWRVKAEYKKKKKDLSGTGNGYGWEMWYLVRVKLHVAAQILINNIF